MTATNSQFPLISVNGQLHGRISPLDRGFAYGDGVFETCRLRFGAAPLWPYHIARLRLACERLRIAFDEQQLSAYLQPLLALAEVRNLADGVLKIVVTRGVPEGQARGYAIPAQSATTYCISIFQAKPLASSAIGEGARLRVCQLRLANSPALAGLKHLNRLEQVLARSEWGGEFDEGLLLNEHDELVEATAANIFWYRDGQWYTPDLTRAGVAGVMRAYLLQTLANVQQVSVPFEELAQAEEVFICNAMIGIWPVSELHVGERQAPYCWSLGVHTRDLQQRFYKSFNDNVSEAFTG